MVLLQCKSNHVTLLLNPSLPIPHGFPLYLEWNQNSSLGTSPVVRWLRIPLAMQGTRVQSLVRKLRSHRPIHCTYCCAPQLESPRTARKILYATTKTWGSKINKYSLKIKIEGSGVALKKKYGWNVKKNLPPPLHDCQSFPYLAWAQEQSEHVMVTVKIYHTKTKKESKATGDRKITQVTENIT